MEKVIPIYHSLSDGIVTGRGIKTKCFYCRRIIVHRVLIFYGFCDSDDSNEFKFNTEDKFLI